LDADAAVFRYARQIALPEIGPEGQARFGRARALVVGGDVAAETAATYLRAAGVGAVSELPGEAGDWLGALDGADVVVRSGFDDDALLGAAARLGVPAVVVHARPDVVDLLSFPRRPTDANAAVDELPRRPASFLADAGAPAILAGTLAAAEALHALLRPVEPGGRPRHLRFPLDGGEPLVQDIGAS
jgi:hypothetical protein